MGKKILDFLQSLFKSPGNGLGGGQVISMDIESTGYTNPNKPPDAQLTAHFTLYQFTNTTHVDLLDMNRVAAQAYLDPLKATAELMEQVLGVLGFPHITITSAYRCPALNSRVGSSSRSQHLTGQACDFVPDGISLDTASSLLQKAMKDGKISFGQLIHETDERGYGFKDWLHISLGGPWRQADKCGQVLTMKNGTYELVATV